MEQDNKRIAKNTMFLYMRLLVTIIVGLFTSRIVLNSLGFVDYGINNVVGGIVMMVAFLNVGMSGASQRFLSYDLGKNDFESLKKTFSTSLWTHISIAVIAFILMESIGTWFVNTKLNIPDARMFAANWVFQCSILVFVVSVISVPYNSCIIAHERMGMYAYISIYEVIAKLVIALLIKFSPTDKLVLYSSLLLLTQISINVIYVVYCKRHFNECVLLRKLDVVLFKEMFAFAGWGCVGNTGFTMKDQGSNIILNLFGGTTVNAARGIAAQVNTIVSSFASNFTMAMNPQVTKLYASGEYDKSRVLAFAGSKYAFLLLSIIVIPFLTNEHYLLTLWLGDIPEYTDMFVCIALICSLIYSLSNTISTAIMATGNVKWFQIGLAIILLSELPISYIILKNGGTLIQAMYPSVFTTLISVIFRIVLIHKLVPSYNITEYCVTVMLRCFIFFLISILLSLYIRSFYGDGFLTFVVTTAFSVIIVLSLIYIIGLNRSERKFVLNKILTIIRK